MFNPYLHYILTIINDEMWDTYYENIVQSPKWNRSLQARLIWSADDRMIYETIAYYIMFCNSKHPYESKLDPQNYSDSGMEFVKGEKKTEYVYL